MRGFGAVMQILGALVLLYACTLDIAAPGSTMVNLGRLHHSVVVNIAGWGMLIFGAVLALGARPKAPAPEPFRATQPGRPTDG